MRVLACSLAAIEMIGFFFLQAPSLRFVSIFPVRIKFEARNSSSWSCARCEELLMNGQYIIHHDMALENTIMALVGGGAHERHMHIHIHIYNVAATLKILPALSKFNHHHLEPPIQHFTTSPPP